MARKPSRSSIDPYTAGQRAIRRGEAFDPDYGLKCTGWGVISAQCLYERGRLKAVALQQACGRPLKAKAS